MMHVPRNVAISTLLLVLLLLLVLGCVAPSSSTDDSSRPLTFSEICHDCVFLDATSSDNHGTHRQLDVVDPAIVTRLRNGNNSEPTSDMPETPPTPARAALHLITRPPIDHLGSVEVYFNIPMGPQEGWMDWVGVYCVDDEAQPNPDADFIEAVATGRRAQGVLSFKRVLNMRCSWQFRLFRSDSERKRHYRLAHTNYVHMRGGREEPLQVHLALTGTPTEMRVMWVSAQVASPEVHFGSAPTALDHKALATTQTYAAADMCEAPATTVGAQAFRDPGHLHEATMTGLTPGETYFYRVGSSTRLGPVRQFKVPPAAGDGPTDGRPQSFFVYGDMGDWDIRPLGELPKNRTLATSELIREDMNREAEDVNWVAAFHDGDISYAKGRTFLWDQFGAIIEPVAAELPYMVGVGNHDYCYSYGGDHDPSGQRGGYHPPNAPDDCSSGGECGVPLNHRFRMPANGNGVFWYSIDIGLMHHIMLSTEHDYTPSSPMYTWLLSDLQRIDRRRTPWVFLHIHRPMYCSEQYEKDYLLSLFIRKNLEPLCAMFGVDVIFSGHYHAYERTCPVFQEHCRSSEDAEGRERALAPVHIMVGSAGAYVDTAGYYTVGWSRIGLETYGYGRMHVFNATHAKYEFKSNEKRSVIDSTWIISDHQWHRDLLPWALQQPPVVPASTTPAPTPSQELPPGLAHLVLESDEDLLRPVASEAPWTSPPSPTPASTVSLEPGPSTGPQSVQPAGGAPAPQDHEVNVAPGEAHDDEDDEDDDDDDTTWW